MNILYCGDEHIREGLLLSILSLLKNTKEKLSIYVLTINTKEIKGISLEDIENIDKIVKEKNKDSFVRVFDITDLFNNEKPEKNMDTRFTPCCMLRLFADKIPELKGKILYLDNDVLARKDFTELYNQDIKEYELAGILDYYGKWFFKNKQIEFNYINSGVLLLNIDKIRETRTI